MRHAKKARRTHPAQSSPLADLIVLLHQVKAPRILMQLVYYSCIIKPPHAAELVDSLEVFAGGKMYSQVALVNDCIKSALFM